MSSHYTTSRQFWRLGEMNLHEYQAKQLLAQHGVEVPGGEPCTTADEARSIAEKLFADGHEMVVMKIQIHSGGRGKGVFLSLIHI